MVLHSSCPECRYFQTEVQECYQLWQQLIQQQQRDAIACPAFLQIALQYRVNLLYELWKLEFIAQRRATTATTTTTTTATTTLERLWKETHPTKERNKSTSLTFVNQNLSCESSASIEASKKEGSTNGGRVPIEVKCLPSDARSRYNAQPLHNNPLEEIQDDCSETQSNASDTEEIGTEDAESHEAWATKGSTTSTTTNSGSDVAERSVYDVHLLNCGPWRDTLAYTLRLSRQDGIESWTVVRHHEQLTALCRFDCGLPPCPMPAHGIVSTVQRVRTWLSTILRSDAVKHAQNFWNFFRNDSTANDPYEGVPWTNFAHGPLAACIGCITVRRGPSNDRVLASTNSVVVNASEKRIQFFNAVESDGPVQPIAVASTSLITKYNIPTHPPTMTSNFVEIGSGPMSIAPCVDSFEILKLIGIGSFGKVYLSSQNSTGELCALKVLKKEWIIKRNQVNNIRLECRLLGSLKHPFIVGMKAALQSKENLYLVLDYCPGGDLFFHLGKLHKLSEERARFYTAEIVLAISHIHSIDVIYRDLKPENLLLDDQGHIRLTDFGLSKEGVSNSSSGASTYCGTPEYLAPEIIDSRGHGKAVDWWSLGILLYEMLTSLPPFYSHCHERMFEMIRHGNVVYPGDVSSGAQSLIEGLLIKNPSRRLGSGLGGGEEIQSHVFFQGMNWEKLLLGEISAPWLPDTCDRLDTSHFAKEFTGMNMSSQSSPPTSFDSSTDIVDASLFEGFSLSARVTMSSNCFEKLQVYKQLRK